MTSLIRFQDVYRDAIQSLMGTNPSADQITQAYENAVLTGVDSIQVAGGTFYDIFAKKGRDEWAELKRITDFFRDKEVDGKKIKLSALIRGDFLFTYEPQSYDVVRATVFEHAKMGINILQNFHGMNDARCLVGVAQAVKEAQEAGYDIVAQGTICVEDKPGTDSDEYIESLVEFARELIEMGHEGIYVKSASGRLNPDMIYKLMDRLYTEFPDQKMTIHAHSTYGEAPICYMAAARAAIEHGKEITMDVQNPALAGSTAQPSMLKMLSLIKNHPLKAMRDNAPKLNIDVIKDSMSKLFAMRFLFRDFEATYNPRLLAAMRKARTPGGASATLKSIPGLVDNLGRMLGTDDWDEIQIAIYEMQAKILPDLGEPTQVTPYAANTTGQAAISLYSELEAVADLKVAIQNVIDEELSSDESITKILSIISDKVGLDAGEALSREFFARGDKIKSNIHDVNSVFSLLESTESWSEALEAYKEQHRYDRLYQGAVNFLVGRHGRVPANVNKDLQAKALKQEGLDEPVEYVLSTDREPALPAAYAAIKAVKKIASTLSPKNAWKGENEVEEVSVIEKPTVRQAISAVLLNNGVQHVIDCFKGENKRIANPQIPFYAQAPANDNEARHSKGGVRLVDIRDAVYAIGGPAKLQEIAERCLHLKQLDDELYHFSRSDHDLNEKWYAGNIKHLAELIDEIPDLLAQEGFTKQQTLVATDENLTAQYAQGANNIMACIRDACDNKGAGLYDHMMSAIKDYKAELEKAAEYDQTVVAMPRRARAANGSGAMTGTEGAVYHYTY